MRGRKTTLELVTWIERVGTSLAAQALLEEVVSEHASQLIARIEAASTIPAVAETIARAHVGDSYGPDVDRFRSLQRRVRDELGIEYFEGTIPFGPLSERQD